MNTEQTNEKKIRILKIISMKIFVADTSKTMLKFIEGCNLLLNDKVQI